MLFRVQSMAILQHSSLDSERVEIFPQAVQGANLVGRDQPMPIGANIEQLIAAPRPAQQCLSE